MRQQKIFCRMIFLTFLAVVLLYYGEPLRKCESVNPETIGMFNVVNSAQTRRIKIC